jgi:acetyltransferase-like isoleucine patch superfamily enzyme
MKNIQLSICIPTFNRSSLLNKCIESIVTQEEFNNQVEIVISDNCSQDNTKEVVQGYQAKYSNIKYYRNETNIGADKNILKVLSLGHGEYLKLSNDYSILKEGSIKLIIDIILTYQSNKSVIFFSNKNIVTQNDITECQNIDQFINRASYWITWILCFGIWKSEFDLLIGRNRKEYNFPHLDLLLQNITLGYKPVICNVLIFNNQPISIKGGYNLFETFIKNYITLLKTYVGKNQISKSTFKNEKGKLLHNFIFPWYCNIVIDKKEDYNFAVKGVNFYLINYFDIRDVLIFIYNTSKYKWANRSKIMVLKKFKKNILNKLARLTYRIIYSNEYRSLEKVEEVIKFRFLGENSRFPSQKIIKNPQYISIGSNFSALQNLRIEAWDEYAGEKFHPEIIIGDEVIMNTEIHIGCIDKVIIGNNVLLASRIIISDHSHGEITKEALSLPPALRPLKSKGPVIIKDNVWIGDGVAILSGVTIGENSIIGANTVVTRSIPANCVVAGNPAKIIKTLV